MNENKETNAAYQSPAPQEQQKSSGTTSSRVPVWFWIVGVISLLWNLMGLMAFAAQMTMTEESMAAFPPEQQELFKNIPTFVYLFFGLAVIGGVLGCILLLMRNKFAVPVLALSLLGVLVQYGHMFFMTRTMEVMGAGAMVLPALVVVISIALIPYATTCKQKGFLR